MTHEQGYILEILKIFSKICDTYHLRYYLAGGTLLGAVRHQGFIPWDDDIDVSMPLSDFLKFQELSDIFPENIEIQSEDNDPNYPFVFIKLCDISHPFPTKNAYGPKGVYIDIFPLLPAKELKLGTQFCFNIISVINYILQIKVGWAVWIPYKKRVARIGFWILNYLSFNRLKKIRKRLINYIYNPDSKKTFCSPGGAYTAEKEFFPIEWFEGTRRMLFEEMYFTVPVGWEPYLSRNYGNYMEPPPLEERHSRHH